MAINIDNSNTGTLTFSPPSSGGNYTLTFPSTAGVNGDSLYIDASGNLLFGTASLYGFTTAINNTGVNATVFVSSITASGGSTNQHFAFNAFGGFAGQYSSLLMMAIPDGTATGGNVRGDNALDFQLVRSGNNQVASGTKANLIGTYQSATGNYATLIGTSGGAMSNVSSSAGTQMVGIAASNLTSTNPINAEMSLNTCTTFFTASSSNEGQYQFTSTGDWLGNVSKAVHLFGCRELSTTANSQMATRRLIWCLTSGTTPIVMTADGNSLTAFNGLGTQNFNTCQLLEVKYIGVATVAGIFATPADFLVGSVQIFSTKGATAATQTATAISNTVIQSGGLGSGWTVTVAANTTLGCPTVTATGSGATIVRWIAFVMTAEVSAQA